jgi:glycosyltransferase involved in cell wall biosynthesis
LLWDRLILGPLDVRTFGVSGHVKYILEKNYGMTPRRVGVLFNGVNVSRFAGRNPQMRAALFAEFGITPENRLLVAAGYFIREKGFSYLLKAMDRISEIRDDVHLILVGDGPVEEELKTEADQLNLNDRVHFAGLRLDVDRFMSASDAVIVPSIWQEPAGLVVVEAMATGRPVIASKVGGIPEYLEDQTCGLLVPPCDPASLADGIIRILSDPELADRMGKTGRRRAEQFFSMEKWVDDTIAIYESSMARRQLQSEMRSETVER